MNIKSEDHFIIITLDNVTDPYKASTPVYRIPETVDYRKPFPGRPLTYCKLKYSFTTN